MKRISVLLIEDNPRFSRLIKEILDSAQNLPFVIEIADNLSQGLELLDQHQFDVALLDLMLPDSQGLETFDALHNKAPDLAVIIQTGMDDEEMALDAVHRGAQDYIIKGDVTEGSLVRAIRYAIERQKLIVELKRAQQQIKTLRGLLPICSYCKKIRDDRGYWNRLETYVAEHTEADFSHSICPDCLQKYFPEFYLEIKDQLD